MFDSNLTIYEQTPYPVRPGKSNHFESVTHALENENIKKKRDEYLVEIRCQQRGKILNNRRTKNLDEAPQPTEVNLAGLETEQTAEENSVLKLHIDACLKKSYRMENFCGIVESLNSEDRFKQHFGVIGIRKILSQGEEPPIQTVIDANLIPRLVQLMQMENEPHLQMEAAWALTNIASGTSQQTQAVIEGGGLPGFIRLLKSTKFPILEQAVWALGNIAGDTIMCRDTILAHGGLPPLVKIVGIAKDSGNEALLQRSTWALSNLIRGKPLAPFELVKGAIPMLSRLIQDEDHYVVLADACWAMVHLSEGNESQIDLVLHTGILPALGKHLDILIPTLRILGNILTGDDEQTNMVLQVPRIVKKLFKLLQHEKKVVRRETCWVLSNIAAGNSVQLGFVIDDQISLDHIIKLSLSDHLEIRKEACWTLSNLTVNGSPEQIIALAQNGLVDCMCNLLNDENADIVGIALDAIYNILNCGSVLAQQNMIDNPFLMLLDSKGGIKKIEILQTHPSFEVYRKATKILENHFEFEEVYSWVGNLAVKFY